MFTVASHYQIMDQLGLKNSSRKLVVNYVISFIINLYLILYTYGKYSLGQRLKLRPNTPYTTVGVLASTYYSSALRLSQLY